MRTEKPLRGRAALGGLAGWVLARLRPAGKSPSRLTLVERIALGPRQSLALIEAEGRRLLVATSGDGGMVFYPLDETAGQTGRSTRRISW